MCPRLIPKMKAQSLSCMASSGNVRWKVWPWRQWVSGLQSFKNMSICLAVKDIKRKTRKGPKPNLSRRLMIAVQREACAGVR